MSGTKKLVKLLMKRDGISRLEAENIIEECREEANLAISLGHWEKVEDIVREYLNLEPDFIMDLLDI